MLDVLEQSKRISNFLNTPKQHVIFGTICLGTASFLIIVGVGAILARDM